MGSPELRKVHGPSIIVRSMTEAHIPDKFGNVWQYHSRSDFHSKVACWAIMYDLLARCKLLRDHVAADKVSFGINHEMHDFRMDRKKRLDLVICTPTADATPGRTLAELGDDYGLALDSAQRDSLQFLPRLSEARVGSTLVALEAKACMTAHIKARPRLYDELSSSFQTIHGDTGRAIAVGLVMINTSDRFVSPDRNKHPFADTRPVPSSHNQPSDARRVLDKVLQLPRRSQQDGVGFDAIGVLLVRLANDGSEVRLDPDNGPDVPVPDIITYGSMIERMAHLYATRFNAI